jgi:hypothetical protein
VFVSCFYVLFKFRFVREGTQGSPLVNPFISYVFKIYDANYFIKNSKKIYFINGLKTCHTYDANAFLDQGRCHHAADTL